MRRMNSGLERPAMCRENAFHRNCNPIETILIENLTRLHLFTHAIVTELALMLS